MGFMKSCGRLVIYYINGLFGLVAAVCLVGGMFVKFGSDDLKSLLPDLMRELVRKIDPILRATHSSSEKFLNNLDLEKLLGNAADVFIVFGAVLLFVVFWGCFGVSCKSKCGLYVIDENLKPQLRSSIKDLYQGDHAMDAISVLWNAVMLKFSCCGVDSSQDFVSGKWNNTPIAEIINANKQLDTPLVCCTEAARSKSATNWWNCAISTLNPSDSNYNKGCYGEVWQYLEHYINIVVGCVGGLAALELLLAIFAISIARGMDKKNKVNSEKSGKGKR
ncbi:tetraspanin-18-like isoform X2 [Crassostrea angulata]|uniref:tetraspanin-18-like isoform X2 n=1 Tax=Magallana angulata TaxID=2784310 RepID=UPI0022B1B237|nr:tetraspanin-18-like isoform X2 [Crassostrea angulata]